MNVVKIKMNKSRLNIFCVADYFLPGFKGGGPITTLANMRSQLHDEIMLSIFTRDRDLGESAQYSDITVDEWIQTAQGPVYYASPSNFGPLGIKRALSGAKFDLIYLNSFFSFKGSFLIIMYFCLFKYNVPVLIAPRGEFSQGALMIKKFKKKLFINFVRTSNLYRNILWHASTPSEKMDIERVFPDATGRIFTAVDPIIFKPSSVEYSFDDSIDESLRIAFISRISPKKNLDGLIRMLNKIDFPVTLDIYGPIEDVPYWKLCTSLISNLPKNIKVSSKEAIAPECVKNTFAKYDIFAFPTHGENFGHVIFEALCAGTQVLVSDQTPWQQDDTGAVTVIPLNQVSEWVQAITKAALSSKDDRLRIRNAARNYAYRFANQVDTKKDNLNILTSAADYFINKKGNC